jgi:hypothetical protein
MYQFLRQLFDLTVVSSLSLEVKMFKFLTSCLILLSSLQKRLI